MFEFGLYHIYTQRPGGYLPEKIKKGNDLVTIFCDGSTFYYDFTSKKPFTKKIFRQWVTQMFCNDCQKMTGKYPHYEIVNKTGFFKY